MELDLLDFQILSMMLGGDLNPPNLAIQQRLERLEKQGYVARTPHTSYRLTLAGQEKTA